MKKFLLVAAALAAMTTPALSEGSTLWWVYTLGGQAYVRESPQQDAATCERAAQNQREGVFAKAITDVGGTFRAGCK